MSSSSTINATLKVKGGGTLVTIPLPTSLYAVPLERFINFLTECRNLEDDGTSQVVTMAKAISAFCDVPVDKIIGGVVGENLENQTLNGTLSSLFGYIINLVAKSGGALRTSDNCEFEHNGARFHIPAILQQALAGETLLPEMSVIEAIEVSEVVRLKTQDVQAKGDPDGALRKKIIAMAGGDNTGPGEQRAAILEAADRVAQIETEKAGDPEGSLQYSMYLRMLAILCRKEGETMPFEDAQREAWINARAAHFQGIDAQTALDIDFFLNSILRTSKSRHPVIGFLTLQSFVVTVATRLKKQKRQTKRESITKKFSGASVGGQ